MHGSKAQGQGEFPKDPQYHLGLKPNAMVINVDKHYHGYIRKLPRAVIRHYELI